MGANAQTYSVSYAIPQEDIVKQWNIAIDNDLHANGHDCYSGGIGTMGHGVSFMDERLPSYEQAQDFLLNKHDKGERALAVSYFNKKQVLKWLIGGWCAS